MHCSLKFGSFPETAGDFALYGLGPLPGIDRNNQLLTLDADITHECIVPRGVLPITPFQPGEVGFPQLPSFIVYRVSQ